MNPNLHGTTILCVRQGPRVVMAGDGQVTQNQTVMKRRAKKVRRLADGRVLAGFAGSTADAFTLFDKFEAKLKEYNNNLTRASVELAKDWRTDRILRRLEAMLLCADAQATYVLTGAGDVVEPELGVAAIGSGGPYAMAAAVALLQNTALEPAEIARRAMAIAADICIYTNHEITLETLEP